MLKATTALLLELMNGEGYGLQLRDRISKTTSGLVDLNPGNLYPTLRTLERQGFVTSREDNSGVEDRGGRPRIVYALTKRGRLSAETQRDAIRSLLGG